MSIAMARRRALMNMVKTEETEGNPIVFNTNTVRGFAGLRLYGASEQPSTTGVQLFDVNSVMIGKGYNVDGNLEDNSQRAATPKMNCDIITEVSFDGISNSNIQTIFCMYDTDGNLINRNINTSDTKKQKFTENTTSFSITFYIGSGTTVTKDMIQNLMLNAGSTPLPYEPYTGGQPSPSPEYPQDWTNMGQENGQINVEVTGTGAQDPQTLIVQTPNGLPGIPVSSGGNYTDDSGQQWVADYLDFETGEYVEKCGKYVFTGEEFENWGENITELTDTLRFDSKKILDNDTSCIGMCNIFKFTFFGDSSDFEHVRFTSIKNYFFVYIKKERLEDYSTESFKKWLSENNLKILYVLETPIRTPLSEEQIQEFKALHANSPTTTIANDSDVWMQAKYKVRR